MRSILEKAFVALLNEEHDKAEEMFHKFIVERARQIHESNRAGDDYVLDENWNDEITTESYFTEEDLADLEGADGDEGSEGGDEFGADAGAEGGEGDLGAEGGDLDGLGGDEGGLDAEGGEPDDLGGEPEEGADERIDHLEDQVEKLVAEFEAMMDAIGDEGDVAHDAEDSLDDGDDLGAEGMGGEEGGDEFGGDDFGAGDEEDADAVSDDMNGTEEEPAMEGADEDEFDDITESIIDELEKVQVSLDDGKEVGAGKTIQQNRSSIGLQKSKDARQGGAPIKMKQSQHKGFERETAPSVETMKARRNNVKTADAALSKVSKEGNKSAEINKLSSENGNTKSPLEGK